MSHSHHRSPVSAADVMHILRRHPLRWGLPTIVVVAAVAVFAYVRPDTWEASQALIVRNEAVQNHDEPGKFHHSDDMRITQETILELTRSKAVLENALRQVGLPAGRCTVGTWPSERDVAQLEKRVTMKAPSGSEFGKTEVFYLKVRDHDRRRAIQLCDAICNNVQTRLQQLRDAKAHSIIDELVRAEALAEEDLRRSTEQLGELERRVGVDLAELRILHESPSAQSDLRQRLVDLDSELRESRRTLALDRELLAVLRESEAEPNRLLAMPSDLLVSQPALARLKDGYVDAQLRTAQLLGLMTEHHPGVIVARDAEQKVVEQIREEVARAVRGILIDIRVVEDRVATLTEQLDDARHRMELLAGLRADYSSLVADLDQRTRVVDGAKRDLADARAAQATAGSVNLISRIDHASTGPKPVGPSRGLIGLAGGVGGLLIGLGIVFVSNPSVPSTGAPSTTSGHQGQTSSYPPLGTTAFEHASGVSLEQALNRPVTRNRSAD